MIPLARRRGRLPLLAVGLLLAGGGGWWWFQGRAVAPTLDYRTAVVSRGDLVQSVTANGQITPVKNVQVGSQISGTLLEVRVDFNSVVQQGDVIAQIDPSSFERSVSQAKAERLSAQAALELARLNHRRASALHAGSLIPQAEFERAEVELHQAEAAVAMREAQLERAEVDLQRTTIYAPIQGVVISRNVDVGQTVAASFNTPTLFLIANDLARMQIEAMVSEADVGGVEEGQRVTFNVDAFPSRQFEGRVRQVRFAPTTNQNVVTYVTVVDVDNPDLKLRPGMTANVTILTSQRTNVVRLPNTALRFRPPTNAVVIAEATPAAGPGTNRPAGAAAPPAAPRPDPTGAPPPPWVAEGRPPSREEMQQWMESLTPEQREQMRQRRERMRAESGDAGGGGRGGGPFVGGFGGGTERRAPADAPATRTIYVLAPTHSVATAQGPVARALTVKTGSTDGTYTEVIEGLKEGDTVITGLNTPIASTTAQGPPGNSPFGRPFGMRPR